MNRRRVIFATLALVAIGAATYGAWLWVHYPTPPDVQKLSIDQALAFMSSDEFNRLRASQRKAFAIAVADKMREKSFGEILWMMSRNDPRREQRFKNLRAIPDHEDVGAAYVRVFLDRFYAEGALKRKVYLTTFAALQQTEIGKHPEQFGLPNAEQFKKDMGRFFSNQSPRVQAQMGQFLIDLKKQRSVLGLKDPF